ncbi:MAG: hypothetical protein IPO15_21230 [Anaerolineae bacterium]|uniref:hypothetical protein n=1 Tax=Candidatus Amarolinea dominans TaxID=3140696 RepID=UPI00313705BE|nr:hypothetical protein [Anaerolineae bacterium]
MRIQLADVVAGETYWRAVGVHHLTPEENQPTTPFSSRRWTKVVSVVGALVGPAGPGTAANRTKKRTLSRWTKARMSRQATSR